VTRIGNVINVESGCYQGHALSAYLYPEAAVVQAWGGAHWKKLLARYRRVERVLFPTALDEVRSTIAEERLRNADDYIAWLELALERGSAPPPIPAFVAAHRALWERCASRGETEGIDG